MCRLSEALEDPNKRSYPKSVRTIQQTEIHKRADKVIQLLEMQNWLESGYHFGNFIWNKYTLSCTNNDSSATVDGLMCRIKQFVLKCKASEQLAGDASKNTANKTTQDKIDDVSITTRDIVQFCITEQWLLSDNQPENSNDILFNCCEELELLAREYSNDEGQQSSVAAGPSTVIETEHPDTLIRTGMQQSVLNRVPLPQPDWSNPLPEHTPGLLQKAFPFIPR